MQPIRQRIAIKKPATKITYVKEGNQIILLRKLIAEPEMVYEIPLMELIIRKGMSKKSKEKLSFEGGYYNYQPSHSYFHFVSKIIPLTKKSK